MDHIQQLLLETGWSCEDLMKKLNEYKQQNEVKTKDDVKSNGIDNKEDSTDTIKECAAVKPKKNEESEEKMDISDDEEKCDVKSNGINHNDDESTSIIENVEEPDVIDVDLEENMNVDDGVIAEIENKTEERIFYPKKNYLELSDHTYTLNSKVDWIEKNRPKYKFRSILKPRRICYVRRARKFRRRLHIESRIDRKLLIAQYKGPDTVRSQILEQIVLLRSKRSEHSVSATPSKDIIVNKKRYIGGKWSTILTDLLQLSEDQNVEIESNDILQNQCDIIIENDFVKKEGDLDTKCNSEKSITETLKNRIGSLSDEPVPGTSSSFFIKVNDEDLKSEIDVENESEIGSELESEDKPSGLKNVVIVDVRGGCEVIPDDKVSEDDKSMIKPTKTNDITKIKGWKNKKFSVANQNKLNKSNSPEAAFSSSNLDGFLEEADLQISFKIPTLDSGKEIKKIEIPPQQTSPKEPDKDLLNLYHPRTLGQKKRILTLKRDVKPKRNVQRPRTLAEKRRLMGNESLTKVYKEIPLNKAADSKQFNSSFVLYRGKKLKVITKNQKEIIAYIKSINKPLCSTLAPKKFKIFKTKPSIFNNYSPTSTVLHYRPGPLCKKDKLQYNNKNWKTTLKKLPKIKLMVIPEFKKPIHPYVEFLMPKYDFEITPDRLEFALTALLPKSKEVTCFEFNVPFQNNQQEILLREKNKNSFINIFNKNKFEHEKIDEICKVVIDKMLNYVEIKEISDDVVKRDVNTKFLEEDKKIDVIKVKSSRKKQKKTNKTNNELKRLSVKVIEVNLEDKDEIKDCRKDFCRLGCICRSLSTNSSLVLTHCGRADCMFECTCNYAQSSKGNIKVTLPTGVDLLSEGAVNRIENVAKRHLAKVEKEFTQTVIQSNNQTIVVGGRSNRQRRVSKLPKKYDEDQQECIGGNSEISSDDLALRQYQLNNSQVSLIKINLDDIVPYCFTHKAYDCECKCTSEYLASEESDFEMLELDDDDEYYPDEVAETSDNINNNKVVAPKKVQYPSFIDSCSRVKGIPTDYYLVRNRTKTFITMRNRRFVRNMNRYWLKHDMQVDSEGIPRERTQREKRPREESPHDETPLEITPFEIEKPKTPPPTTEVIKITSEKSRRKQELIVREDSELPIIPTPSDNLYKPKKLRPIKPKPPQPNTSTPKEFFLNYKSKENTASNDSINPERINKIKQLETTLKTSSKQFEENTNQITQSIKLLTENLKQVEEASNSVKEDLNRVDENLKLFREESKPMKRFKMIFPAMRENVHYFHPSSDISDRFLNMLGRNDDTKFILLQWKTLAYYYQLSKINVWFSSFYKSPKIIITDLFIQPKHFTNVKHFERSHNKFLLKNEIIRALITGNIPGNNLNDEIQVILELTDMLCYVHGTFKKNLNKDKNNSHKKHSRKDKDLNQENKLKLQEVAEQSIISTLPSSATNLELITINTPSNSSSPLPTLTITPSRTSPSTTSTSSTSPSKQITTISSKSPPLSNKSSQNDSSLDDIEISEVEPGKEKEKTPIFNYPTVRKVMFSKYKCQEHSYESIDKDNEIIIPCTIQARLPLIKNSALWRMIKLNSDFSVLALEKSDYRIKYSDLQKVLKMADDKQMTIAIRTEQTSNSTRSHKDFGIYASPMSSNSVFIGPYLQSENHDVVLMRYLNRELITTEKFNSMKGLPRSTSGVWLQQKKDSVEKNLHTIDLTESDREDNNKSDDEDDDDEEEYENKPILTARDLEIFENDALNYHYTTQSYVEIDVTKVNVQNMLVMFFNTNVKNLGYILGYQLGKDTIILKYPNPGNKAFKFKNKALASEFLEKELSSSFIEAAGFKIKVTPNGIRRKTSVLFNPILLKGYYVIHGGGFIDVLEITPAKLKELNMTETKLCRGVSHRAARMVYDRCLEASQYCTSAPFIHTRKSTRSLLQWLKDEVEELKAEGDRKNVQLTVFHQQRPMLVEHFKEIYLDLAPNADAKLKRKLEEVLKVNGILMDDSTTSQESPPKEKVVICIDIDEAPPSPPKVDRQETNLPIYTKNPDMIITATTSKNEKRTNNNSEKKLPKVSVKDISTLQEKGEEKIAETKNDKPSASDKPNKMYKYLYKTTKGKLIEIAPEQYEILKANKLKSAVPTNSQEKTFQLGSLTVTPKLSKIGVEPLISKLPAAELKNIVIPDNLPPGFVKLTLKNIPKELRSKELKLKELKPKELKPKEFKPDTENT